MPFRGQAPGPKRGLVGAPGEQASDTRCDKTVFSSSGPWDGSCNRLASLPFSVTKRRAVKGQTLSFVIEYEA